MDSIYEVNSKIEFDFEITHDVTSDPTTSILWYPFNVLLKLIEMFIFLFR